MLLDNFQEAARHVDSKVNDDFLAWTKSKYEHEGIGEVKVTRCKEHEYLAMGFDYSINREAKVKVTKYIQK